MDVLPNDEVAALAPAPPASSGPAAPQPLVERRRKPRRVREIDFTRPTKFTTDQMRRIERAHEGFCRAAGGHLSSELRTEIEFEVINIAQLTLAGALAEVPSSTLYGVVRVDDTGLPLMLGIELNAVAAMIERLLGGGGGPTPIPADRELTEIEKALSRRVFGKVVEELSSVWQELFQTGLALDRIEPQLMNLQLGGSTEPTVSITIEFRAGELSATTSLVVPYRAIEAIVDRLPSAQAETLLEHDADAGTVAAVRATLASVEVELRVEVGVTDLPLSSVLALRAGDTLPLGTSSSAGVTVFADGVATHRARPGRRGRRRAIEILERLETL